MFDYSSRNCPMNCIWMKFLSSCWCLSCIFSCVQYTDMSTDMSTGRILPILFSYSSICMVAYILRLAIEVQGDPYMLTVAFSTLITTPLLSYQLFEDLHCRCPQVHLNFVSPQHCHHTVVTSQVCFCRNTSPSSQTNHFFIYKLIKVM